MLQCLILIDVTHIIKIFCRLKYLSDIKNKYFKQFYGRELRLSLTSTELRELKHIFTTSLTIMSETDDGWLNDKLIRLFLQQNYAENTY